MRNRNKEELRKGETKSSGQKPYRRESLWWRADKGLGVKGEPGGGVTGI